MLVQDGGVETQDGGVGVVEVSRCCGCVQRQLRANSQLQQGRHLARWHSQTLLDVADDKLIWMTMKLMIQMITLTTQVADAVGSTGLAGY